MTSDQLLFHLKLLKYLVKAVEHSWPWIVSIQDWGIHICGGSIINDKHVLTGLFKNVENHKFAHRSNMRAS